MSRLFAGILYGATMTCAFLFVALLARGRVSSVALTALGVCLGIASGLVMARLWPRLVLRRCFGREVRDLAPLSRVR